MRNIDYWEGPKSQIWVKKEGFQAKDSGNNDQKSRFL